MCEFGENCFCDLSCVQQKKIGKSSNLRAYFVTDWTGAKLYRIQKNGKFKVVAEVGKGAADHEVILDKNLVIIPIMAEGKVIALKVE